LIIALHWQSQTSIAKDSWFFTTEDTESMEEFLFTRVVSGHEFARAERCARNDGLLTLPPAKAGSEVIKAILSARLNRPLKKSI
jgi:hypothetical protein